MNTLPIILNFAFIITTLLTLGIFYWCVRSSEVESSKKLSSIILFVLICWLLIQGYLSAKNVYLDDPDSIPPKIFLFGILPTLLTMLWLFLSQAGKRFIDKIDVKKLTYLHLVRIPVELVLYALFINLVIPQILTFDGWNFDIVMGLTAPFILYFGFAKQTLSKQLILVWNIIGIFLLLLVFGLAVLSSPSPLQKLAFDQPNIGLLMFPFSWLPTFIVPIVILGHLITIRRLLN